MGALIEYKTYMKNPKIYIPIIVLVLAVAGLVFAQVRQNRNIRAEEARALSKIDYNFGSTKGAAYLVSTSNVSYTKTTMVSCGSDLNKDIAIGNFQLVVVKKTLGVNRAYRFNLPGMSFALNQDKLWNGQLRKVNLDLAGRNADNIALYQYQDCDHARAYLFNINPNSGHLEPYQFRTLDNQVNPVVVTRTDVGFVKTGKDKMDTVVGSGELAKPYAIVHWQFDPKSNFFKQTGKDLSATK